MPLLHTTAFAFIALMASSCVGSGFDGRHDRSQDSDRSRSERHSLEGKQGSEASMSCLVAPLTSLYYETPTFSDFATAWGTIGNGSWSVSGGELVQSSTTASLAYAYHQVSIADYRIVAALHATSGGNGKAVELALRINPANSSSYHCNWQPADGGFLIMSTDSSGQGGMPMTIKYVDLAALRAWNSVVMELQVVGSSLQCCLQGVAGAYLSTQASQLSSGAVGVKTYTMSATFHDFRVYR